MRATTAGVVLPSSWAENPAFATVTFSSPAADPSTLSVPLGDG